MACRVLRSSMYRGPFDPAPVTMVTRERDAKVPLETMAKELEDLPSVFLIVSDIFEVDEDTYNNFPKATIAGMRRLQDSTIELAERNMAVAFFWNANAIRRINNGGTLAATKPAPLSRDQLITVMRQLCKLSYYEGQTIIQIDQDGVVVTMKDGRVVS